MHQGVDRTKKERSSLSSFWYDVPEVVIQTASVLVRRRPHNLGTCTYYFLSLVSGLVQASYWTQGFLLSAGVVIRPAAVLGRDLVMVFNQSIVVRP